MQISDLLLMQLLSVVAVYGGLMMFFGFILGLLVTSMRSRVAHLMGRVEGLEITITGRRSGRNVPAGLELPDKERGPP